MIAFDYQKNQKDYQNEKADNKSRFVDAMNKESFIATMVVILNLLLQMGLVT